ncbi:hypothetical protein [Leekyejoonella antrihumi]|uniref:hypothetical protein n=1 Tax=Leekyejoonella antrihumi TaxID=1660198 RepID=UPI001649033A|nr:hypothetical protein [Leekyejoonella antrihumi]
MTATGTLNARPWGRGRLVATAAALLAVAIALVCGLGLGVYYLIAGGGGHSSATSIVAPATITTGHGPAHRDRVAAARMLQVPPDAAAPSAPAATPGPSLRVPVAQAGGPAEIATGYPRTPAGAIGQLAALEAAVLQQMSITQANAAYAAWALPGAVPIRSWTPMTWVQAGLATGLLGVPSAPITLTATPVAGQVKGSDGPDWVVACVLFRLEAVRRATTQVAVADCERMQWRSGRWMIAPGAPPAVAPATWPGTPISIRAGWKTWTPVGDD